MALTPSHGTALAYRPAAGRLGVKKGRPVGWLCGGAEVASDNEAGVGAGKSVVVINDSPEMLELAESLLEDEDFDVKVALSGARALELVRTTLPDLVILDVRLPDVNGWDILQALKLDQRTASIPVLVCSAAIQELRELEPQLAGMGVDVLVKPFALDTLMRKVRALTGAEAGG
jgi:CheY-like chemotaxis protein